MSEYGPRTKLTAFNWHQNRGSLPPITCYRREHEYHVKMVASSTQTGTVYLECPECGWYQQWDHDYVVDYWRDCMAAGVASFHVESGGYIAGGTD